MCKETFVRFSFKKEAYAPKIIKVMEKNRFFMATADAWCDKSQSREISHSYMDFFFLLVAIQTFSILQ